MKSILSAKLSPDLFWEFSYLCFAIYLLFYPALSFPQSTAVVLGGGLVLFLFRTVPGDAFEKLGLFWILFLLYTLGSALWSVSPGVTLQSSGFLFLATLLVLMAQSGNLASKNRIEMTVLILAVIAALIGMDQWLFGFAQLAKVSSGLLGNEADIVNVAVLDKRAFGPLVTPGALAAFLIFTIPQALIRFQTASGSKKVLFGLLSIVLLLGLAAAGGVGAWLCLAVVCAFFFYKQSTGPAAFFVLGLLGLAALGLVWHRGLHNWTLASFTMRLDLWQSGWQLFLQHPLMGWGLGTFGEAYQSMGMPLGTGALFAHNLFLQLLVETGIAGTLLFTAAVISLGRHLVWPARWEGWGVLGGLLAVGLFSLLDLPFQMAELIWIFAGVAGRLEWRSGSRWKLPEVSSQCVSWGLLVILAVTGFWPPYRPWNFCLLAAALWTAFALFEAQIKELKWWVVLGAVYLAARAFVSPSASGAVWFLELTGLLIVFYFTIPKFPRFETFWMIFAGLGFLWAVKLGWYSLVFAPQNGILWWIDVANWVFNPNPKHLAVFFIPLVFILLRKPISLNWLKTTVLSLALLIVFRLKALGALAGLGAGWLWSIRKEKLKLSISAFVLILALITFRVLNGSATKWERWGIWNSAVKVWIREPLFGVGPGAFAGLYHQVKGPRLDGVSRYLMDARYAHNEFLDLLTGFGLVGFVFVLYLLFQTFQRIRKDENKNALLGLGAASFFDFCLHGPLIALLGVGLTVKEEKAVRRLSLGSGFLVFGLTAGLFGAPIFSQALQKQAEDLVSQKAYPQAFRCWHAAVQLNSWDAQTQIGESNFYEELYLATHDVNWKNKADETLETAMNLEKTDGDLVFAKARRWTRRHEMDPNNDNFLMASQSWAEAEKALPFSGFLTFEEGLFWSKMAQISAKNADLAEGYTQKAFNSYALSARLEPNFAAAWVNLGVAQAKKRSERPGESQEEAYFDFKRALEVYDQWKDASGLSPEEKQMVDLPPQEVAWLRKEVHP
jgi:O-antigen ligase